MPAVWKSNHPLVLSWWADAQKRDKRYTRECRKVEKQHDRNIVLRTGFGDDVVMGLSRAYGDELPPGWKFGKDGGRSWYMVPRWSPSKKHPKADCEEAQSLIKRLNDLRPNVRSECHERFGTPTFQLFGLRAISPGFFEHDGVLWMTFGTHDYEPPEAGSDDEINGHGGPKMLDYFEPAKKSEYYTAREAAGLEDDE